MRAIYEKEKNRIQLDSEAIKAIRFVNGFTTDLRVKLDINRTDLWWWVSKNVTALVGPSFEFAYTRPAVDSDEWERYDRCIESVVRQVCGR